jgi:hypothetical protein
MSAVQLGPASWGPFGRDLGTVKYYKDLPLDPDPGDLCYVLHQDDVGYTFVWNGTAWVVYAQGQVLFPNLLTGLVLGVYRTGEGAEINDRWLRCGTRPLVGQTLQFGDEQFLGTISELTQHDGGTVRLSVPDGSVVSSIGLTKDLWGLSVWYRPYIGPADFKLGPEQPGVPAKEPRDNGEGKLATQDGCIMSGFQLMKDPDQTLAIEIMYRPVL